MPYLFALLLTVFAAPCFAQTSPYTTKTTSYTTKTPAVYTAKKNAENNEKADARQNANQKILDTVSAALKKRLPLQLNKGVTWTEAYGRGNALHFVYKMSLDLTDSPREQVQVFKKEYQKEHCPDVAEKFCPLFKDELFKRGISLYVHYFDAARNELATCRASYSDCK